MYPTLNEIKREFMVGVRQGWALYWLPITWIWKKLCHLIKPPEN